MSFKNPYFDIPLYGWPFSRFKDSQTDIETILQTDHDRKIYLILVIHLFSHYIIRFDGQETRSKYVRPGPAGQQTHDQTKTNNRKIGLRRVILDDEEKIRTGKNDGFLLEL